MDAREANERTFNTILQIENEEQAAEDQAYFERQSRIDAIELAMRTAVDAAIEESVNKGEWSAKYSWNSFEPDDTTAAKIAVLEHEEKYDAYMRVCTQLETEKYQLYSVGMNTTQDDEQGMRMEYRLTISWRNQPQQRATFIKRIGSKFTQAFGRAN